MPCSSHETKLEPSSGFWARFWAWLLCCSGARRPLFVADFALSSASFPPWSSRGRGRWWQQSAVASCARARSFRRILGSICSCQRRLWLTPGPGSEERRGELIGLPLVLLVVLVVLLKLSSLKYGLILWTFIAHLVLAHRLARGALAPDSRAHPPRQRHQRRAGPPPPSVRGVGPMGWPQPPRARAAPRAATNPSRNSAKTWIY